MTLRRIPSPEALQARNEAILVRMEVPFARAVKNLRNAFVEQCASDYLNGDRAFDGEAIAHRAALRLILEDHYRRVIARFARLTAGDLATLTQKAEETWIERLIREWIATEALRRSRQITETARTDVLTALEKGFEAGEGTESIARRIRTVAALSAYRAAVVARTETHQAALYAQAGAAKEAERTYGLRLMKQWVPTLDSRTRDAHAAMARHPAIPLDQKFTVGGVLMDRPGDPFAPASLTVNCRCTLIHREAPDDQGT